MVWVHPTSIGSQYLLRLLGEKHLRIYVNMVPWEERSLRKKWESEKSMSENILRVPKLMTAKKKKKLY